MHTSSTTVVLDVAAFLAAPCIPIYIYIYTKLSIYTELVLLHIIPSHEIWPANWKVFQRHHGAMTAHFWKKGDCNLPFKSPITVGNCLGHDSCSWSAVVGDMRIIWNRDPLQFRREEGLSPSGSRPWFKLLPTYCAREAFARMRTIGEGWNRSSNMMLVTMSHRCCNYVVVVVVVVVRWLSYPGGTSACGAGVVFWAIAPVCGGLWVRNGPHCHLECKLVHTCRGSMECKLPR